MTATLLRAHKRDAPEVTQVFARSEYRSARAAAIAAGIVKKPVPLVDQARRWVARMTSEENTELVRNLRIRVARMTSEENAELVRRFLSGAGENP